ncbi:hypothetical protein, partial [Aeromicrobium duanguangcaii]|uniref:hypothetical protein n=1 Tax=Aeromicrobium duanguangcaii TaxID=2968086 RepID=UPI0020175D2A
VWQDDRDTSTAHYRNGLPWLSKNINIHNNVFSYGTNFCPVLTQDLRQKWTGNDFGITMNGNAYHRPSPKNPERFACWANGKKGTESFPTLTAFRNATGQDPQSTLSEGAAITDGLGRLIASLAAVPRALPAKIAAAAGQAVGAKRIGAFGVPLK